MTAASSEPSLLAALASQLGGTTAIPAVQRSQYLAAALQNLQSTGGQNLRTPMALGSNLLADALLQYGRSKTDKELMGIVSKGQSGMFGGPSIYAPAPADAGPSGQGLGIGGAAGGSPPVAPAPVSGDPLASALMNRRNQDDAVNMAYGEARGEGAPGRQAVIGVAQNRAKLEGLTPSDMTAGLGGDVNPATGQPWEGVSPLSQEIRQPGQFEGFNPSRHLDPNSPIYQSILKDIQPILDGGASPGGSADHFWSPGAQAQMGRQPPAWGAQGSPQMIGHQQFSSLGYGGQPPLQSPASGQQFAPAPPPPAVLPAGVGQPYQVAALGQTPPPPGAGIPAGGIGAPPPMPQPVSMPGQMGAGGPMPSPQGQGAPPPPAQMAQGPAPQQLAQAPQGPPTGAYATPGERQIIEMGRSQPPGSPLWQRALETYNEVQKRVVTPLAPPKDMMWGPNGQAVAIPGMQYQNVSAGPGGAVQTDPFGQYHATSNPNSGAIPPGMTIVQGANGPQLVHMGDAPRPLITPADRAAQGISPADRNTYVFNPVTQRAEKTADNPYGPKEIQSVHDNFWGSDETKKSQEAYSAFTGLTGALRNATGNNGPLDQAAIDSFLRGINPGMGARNSTVQMVMDHFGLPQEIQGKISSLTGGGFVTPKSLQQMVQVTHDYALAHQNSAQARAAADAKMVAPYGYGASDLSEDLPTLGPVPNINFSGGGNGGGVQPPNGYQPPNGGGNRLFPSTLPNQAGAPAERAALEAEARRRGLIR